MESHRDRVEEVSPGQWLRGLGEDVCTHRPSAEADGTGLGGDAGTEVICG